MSTGNSFSLVTNRRSGINYPSPFFDISSTYVPPSMKEFFKWTRFFYFSHSVIHPIIDKISEYPITGLTYQVGDDKADEKLSMKAKDNWKKLLEDTLRIKSLLVEMLLDYNVYGNAFVSIMYPIKRYLKCRDCDHKMAIEKTKYIWKDFKFKSKCEKCAHEGVFDVSDARIKNRSMCRTVRWNPFNITIKHNSITNEREYWYRISNKDIKAIVNGDKSWIERTPWVFIDAVRKKKQIELDPKNLYHMMRPSIADNDMSWGMPIILPVIKDCYWLQILRKANEQVAIEHIVPWRILFPASNAEVSPYVSQNLSTWKSKVEVEVKRWRQDCVSPESFIDTIDGPIPADDVKVGDYVYTAMGRYKKVVARVDRDIRPGEMARKFHIRSLRDFPTTFSPNHGVLAMRKTSARLGHHPDNEPKFYQASDLEAGDYVMYPCGRDIWGNQILDIGRASGLTCTEDYVYSSSRVSERKAGVYEYILAANETRGRIKRKEYLQKTGATVKEFKSAQNSIHGGSCWRRLNRRVKIGYDLGLLIGHYLGDGSAGGSNRTQLCIYYNKTQAEWADECDAAVDRVFNYRPTRTMIKESCLVQRIGNKIIARAIANLCPGTARNKSIPDEFMHGDAEAVRGLLTGLLRADGHCMRNESGAVYRVAYTSSSLKMAYQVRQLLLSLGLCCSIVKHTQAKDSGVNIRGRSVRCSQSYRVRVHGAAARRLAAYLGWGPDNATAEEAAWGRNGFIKDGHYVMRISKIEDAPECDRVIGFQVEEDETFGVLGYTSHNSNHISIMPIPVGTQNFGGDAKLLQMWQEEKLMQQQIAGGMGVPLELLFGGLNWSGSSVSLRILENHFIRDREEIDGFLNQFLIPNLQRYFRLTKIKIKQKNFKMADDVQQKQLMMQLLQTGKMSDSTFMEENDLDFQSEAARRMQEQNIQIENQRQTMVQQAEVQGAVSVISARYQALAQAEGMKVQQANMPPQMMMPPGAPGSEGAPGQGAQGAPAPQGAPNGQPGQPNGQPIPMAQGGLVMPPNGNGGGNGYADQQAKVGMVKSMVVGIQRMDEAAKEMLLSNFEKQNPGLAKMIRQELKKGAKDSIDMRPLPEQKPPRRTTGPI